MAQQQHALAIVLFTALLIALVTWLQWPPSESTFKCPNSEISLDKNGITTCGFGYALPAGQLLTLGLSLNLNRVSKSDLTLLPGIGPHLSHALVEERQRIGGFSSWEQVDEVHGVGPVRLNALQQNCQLGEQ